MGAIDATASVSAVSQLSNWTAIGQNIVLAGADVCATSASTKRTSGAFAHARVLLERFRVEYNTEHLHSSLGYLTPVEFAATCSAGAA